MTLDELEQQRAALQDVDKSSHVDELATLQQRINEVRQRRLELDRRIGNAKMAETTLASLPPVSPDQAWLDHLEAWRKVLCAELLALPNRIRDAHTLGVQTNLTLSIRCIDFGPGVFKNSGYDLPNTRLGELMRAAGYEPEDADPDRNYSGVMPWFGTLPKVEERVKRHAARRAAAQSMLDDALMGDTERTKRDAESKARRDALNALPTRKVRGDGTMFDRYPDGRCVEVTS